VITAVEDEPEADVVEPEADLVEPEAVIEAEPEAADDDPPTDPGTSGRRKKKISFV
jgi:hypothetical protein